jgi:hypothetical protein
MVKVRNNFLLAGLKLIEMGWQRVRAQGNTQQQLKYALLTFQIPV